jgi:hypothetical protein
VDRPNPGHFRDEETDPSRPDERQATAPRQSYSVQAQPAGGYPRMPATAPDPVGHGATLPEQPPVMSSPPTVRRFDPWNYREEAAVGDGADIVGYGIEAIDGHIGKVDAASTQVGDGYLVVDTGPWIFGKRVLLPAGTVNHVDSLEQKVYVDRAKAQIKDAPEFDPDQFGPEYREKIGSYYDSTYQIHSRYGDSRSVG